MAIVYMKISAVLMNIYKTVILTAIALGKFRCNFCRASLAKQNENLENLNKRYHGAINHLLSETTV